MKEQLHVLQNNQMQMHIIFAVFLIQLLDNFSGEKICHEGGDERRTWTLTFKQSS